MKLQFTIVIDVYPSKEQFEEAPTHEEMEEGVRNEIGRQAAVSGLRMELSSFGLKEVPQFVCGCCNHPEDELFEINHGGETDHFCSVCYKMHEKDEEVTQ